MINFKKEIANIISKKINISSEEVLNLLQIVKDEENGDYSFPCFTLSKNLKKAPKLISDELKNDIEVPKFIEKIESVNGYLNFYLKKEELAKEVCIEYEKTGEKYGNSSIGKGKTVLIEYSSPNIAKPFHIGHMRGTIIGSALYNIYKFLGYKVVSINHLGDYGTQFGKLIEAYKLWNKEYNLEENPIDELTKMYVRINALCDEDEKVLERCRNNFKLLENKDEYYVNLWKKFSELSLKEFQKVYDLLDIKFDSLKGESFYIDKMKDVIDILEANNKLTFSNGAKIVDLTKDGINTPCIIQKSNGSSIYATRDLAAIIYRSKTYDYDKCIYVVGNEQDLHFKQIFAVSKYLNLDKKYIDGLTHVSFGMIRLKTGKLSTRKGNVIKLEDILNESISRAKKIIEEKNPELEEIEETAKRVGIGAVIFNDLYNSRIKDEIFDYDIMLNFQGETCPYVQYMYVRINSILSKADKNYSLENVKFNVISDDLSYKILKLIYNFNVIVEEAAKKNEPYIISRYLIDLSKAYSLFYNSNKILVEDEELKASRIYLIKMVKTVLKKGSNILGIKMPNKM